MSELAESLAVQQRWLLGAIMGADGPSDWARVKATAVKLTPAQRVQIYRHAYVQRLLECLSDDFPAVALALGVEAFEGCCRDYIVRHPPQSATLNTYGERFSGFLRDHASLGLERRSWVSELAALEWATVRAIHADAGATLRLEELGRVPLEQWGDLTLATSDTLQLLEFRHSVNAYLSALTHARPSDVVASPPARASWVLVCRRGPEVRRVDIANWGYALLSALREGRNLADALEAVLVRRSGVSVVGEITQRGDAIERCVPPVDASAVMGCFRDWVTLGVFTSCTIVGA